MRSLQAILAEDNVYSSCTYLRGERSWGSLEAAAPKFVLCAPPPKWVLTNIIFEFWQLSFYDMHSNVRSFPKSSNLCPIKSLAPSLVTQKIASIYVLDFHQVSDFHVTYCRKTLIISVSELIRCLTQPNGLISPVSLSVHVSPLSRLTCGM